VNAAKAIEELYAYRERKMERQGDYGRNLEAALAVEDWRQADIYLAKANELDAEVKVIEHCIRIVRNS